MPDPDPVLSMVVGEVVVSLRGRDQSCLGVVVGTDDKYVYVCDGKHHRLGSPKRKNPRHVASLSVTLAEDERAGDAGLRRALARLRDLRKGGTIRVEAR